MTAAPTRRRSDVVAAAPRLAERARAERSARRARRVRLAGRALLLLVPLGALGWVLLASGWLAVDRVELRGLGRLTPAQVQAAVAVEPGTPLARVDTADVERRVARLAPVERVEVLRSWPDSLRVVVTERVAVAGVLQGGAVGLVDRNGVAFATERALPPDVVRLEVRRLGPSDDATRDALAVLQALPAPLRSQVAAVRAPSAGRVVLQLTSGQQVVWGAPGDDSTKAAAARALLRLPGEVVDVSNPGLVVRRSAAAAASATPLPSVASQSPDQDG